MARMSRKNRIAWLEKQMSIQEQAIIDAKSMNDITVHGYLLRRLTDEWCELMKKETK